MGMSVMVVAVPILCVTVGMTGARPLCVFVCAIVNVHYQFYCTSLPTGLQPRAMPAKNGVIGKYDTTGERIR
jgi:hypothetical protein